MRVVQQAAGTVLGAGWSVFIGGDVGVGDAEVFEFTGGFVAEDAGEQAHGGVDDYGGGKLASAEDVVADGKLHVAVELVDALIYTLVAAAEKDDAVEGSDFAGQGLGEGAALGAEEYYCGTGLRRG